MIKKKSRFCVSILLSVSLQLKVSVCFRFVIRVETYLNLKKFYKTRFAVFALS